MLGLLPGETENQSAPGAAPASTLYSFKYHVWEPEEIDECDSAPTRGHFGFVATTGLSGERDQPRYFSGST